MRDGFLFRVKSAEGNDFSLRTVVADQNHGYFTGLFIVLRGQSHLIRPASQAFHVKLAERTFRRRLPRLIIFAALKPSCGIHARSLGGAVGQWRSSLKQFRLFLMFFQRRMVGVGQDVLPASAEPRVIVFRLEDEWHPMMIPGHGLVGQRGEHRVFFDTGFLAPQPGEAERLTAGLPEQHAFLVKSIGGQQTAVFQERAEGGQGGQRFGLGINERAFVPRHTPAPMQFATGEAIVFRHDDRAGVGGADAGARHGTEDLNLLAQPELCVVAVVGVMGAHAVGI